MRRFKQVVFSTIVCFTPRLPGRGLSKTRAMKEQTTSPIQYDPTPANAGQGRCIFKIDCPVCGFLNLAQPASGVVEEDEDHVTECQCVRCGQPFHFIIEIISIGA